MKENLYSLEIEQSVLSALMSLTAGIDDVMGELYQEAFYATRHSVIFKHVKKLYDTGIGFDILMVLDSIKLDFNDSKLVDEKYLIDLNSSIGNAHLLSDHSKKIIDYARRRALFDAGERIKTIAIDTTQYDTESAISQSDGVLANLDSTSNDKTCDSAYNIALDMFGEINKRIEDRSKGIEKINGVKTGFIDLDDKIGFMGRGELIIIAARPAMGKTTLIQNMMDNIAFIQQHPVLFQSAEMPREAIVRRLVSSHSNVTVSQLRNARVPDEKWKDVNESILRLDKSKLMIDDKSSPTISHIRKNCRKLKSKYGYVGAVFIDYLTLLTPPLKTDQNYLAVGSISKALSALAKEFDCPVFCLSQLSRKVEDRADKRPQMADLRESGQIEQDANTILFIYRDEVYNKTSQSAGFAEIIAAKVRDGETGTVILATELEYSRFVDAELVRNEY